MPRRMWPGPISALPSARYKTLIVPQCLAPKKKGVAPAQRCGRSDARSSLGGNRNEGPYLDRRDLARLSGCNRRLERGPRRDKNHETDVTRTVERVTRLI